MTIAFVFGVIASRICSGDELNVRRSQSTSTGVAPLSITGVTQEIIVNEGIMTSSPVERSRAFTAQCRAAVPLETAIPCFRPCLLANASSNCFTKGPSEEIHPFSIASKRYFASFPSNLGTFTGIEVVFKLNNGLF